MLIFTFTKKLQMVDSFLHLYNLFSSKIKQIPLLNITQCANLTLTRLNNF